MEYVRFNALGKNWPFIEFLTEHKVSNQTFFVIYLFIQCFIDGHSWTLSDLPWKMTHFSKMLK